MNFFRRGTQYATSWLRWPQNNSNDTATGVTKDAISEEDDKKTPEASADITKAPQILSESQKLREDSKHPVLEQANKFKDIIHKEGDISQKDKNKSPEATARISKSPQIVTDSSKQCEDRKKTIIEQGDDINPIKTRNLGQADVGTDVEDETSSDVVDVKRICSESSQNNGGQIAHVLYTTQDTSNAVPLGSKEKSCIPEKLNLIKASSSEITLRWDAPPAEYNISHYEIRYRESTEKTTRWNIFETDDNRTNATIIDLKAGAEFEVKVRAVDKNGEEGPYHTPIKVATLESLANKVRLRSTLHSNGCPSVYLLPMKHEKMFDNEKAKARKFVLGKANANCVHEKTVLVIGASKSGKSLTIDGMVNYILGVSWNEDYRFSLAQELSSEISTDTDDKTEWITCIRVNHSLGSQIDYNINIIEIPGFGNLEKDKQIVNRIQDYFTTEGEQGITCLNAVCLVIPASTALSTEQKYIFDAILSIFDKKVAENMLILATFGDGDEPQVTEALNVAHVPYRKCLQVNNVAWFGSNKNKRLPNEIYWDMSCESLKTFFLEIERAESISLLLTKVVLKNREKIEATIRGLLPQIEEGTNKLSTLQEEVLILERHESDVKEYTDFKYKVTETHQRKVDLETGKYVTNCLQCNRTCHYPCALPDDDDKANCAAMCDGNCMVCPGKCPWQKHKNNIYRFEIFPIEVEKTYEDIKKKYHAAKENTKQQKVVIEEAKQAFSLLKQDVSKTIQKVAGFITELNTIAFKPDHFGVADYIDIVLENEKKEKKPGWENRTKIYSKMRDEAQLMSNVQDSNFLPWAEDDLLKFN